MCELAAAFLFGFVLVFVLGGGLGPALDAADDYRRRAQGPPCRFRCRGCDTPMARDVLCWHCAKKEA